MTKTFYFYDDTWWDSNGCSCCDDVEMTCYNISEADHPTFAGQGSAHSKEDCLKQVLFYLGLIEEDHEETYFEDDCEGFVEHLWSLKHEHNIRIEYL